MRARYTKSKFTPCPEGVWPAVCCDVQDLGEVDTAFGRKFRVRLVFQVADVDPNTDERYTATTTLTNSMNKSASLRKLVESWRGKSMTEREAQDFDLERLLGANALIQVVHSTKNDKTTAFVDNVLPPMKGTPKLTIVGYCRLQDRGDKNSISAYGKVETTYESSREPGEDDGEDTWTPEDDIAYAMGPYDGDPVSEPE